jgi:hypothetical protein
MNDALQMKNYTDGFIKEKNTYGLINIKRRSIEMKERIRIYTNDFSIRREKKKRLYKLYNQYLHNLCIIIEEKWSFQEDPIHIFPTHTIKEKLRTEWIEDKYRITMDFPAMRFEIKSNDMDAILSFFAKYYSEEWDIIYGGFVEDPYNLYSNFLLPNELCAVCNQNDVVKKNEQCH